MSIFLELLQDDMKTVSPLLLEIFLEQLPHCAEEGMSDLDTLGYMQDTYATVLGKTISKEEAAAILHHLVGESTGNSAETPLDALGAITKPTRQQRGFATDFAKFMDSMELDDCCFILAGGDPEKAAAIYRYQDYRLVKAMRSTWQQFEMQKAQVTLEAAVFGMGGSFGDTSDEFNEVYDLTTDDLDMVELNDMMKFH